MYRLCSRKYTQITLIHPKYSKNCTLIYFWLNVWTFKIHLHCSNQPCQRSFHRLEIHLSKKGLPFLQLTLLGPYVLFEFSWLPFSYFCVKSYWFFQLFKQRECNFHFAWNKFGAVETWLACQCLLCCVVIDSDRHLMQCTVPLPSFLFYKRSSKKPCRFHY